MKLGWITNIHDKEAEEFANELSERHDLCAIMIGKPKPTDTYTTDQLIDMEIVGLYACDYSTADQMRGFCNILVFGKKMNLGKS